MERELGAVGDASLTVVLGRGSGQRHPGLSPVNCLVSRVTLAGHFITRASVSSSVGRGVIRFPWVTDKLDDADENSGLL